jgi:hypothetical protein
MLGSDQHEKMETAALRTWAATGETPFCHLLIGRLEGQQLALPIKRVSTAALRAYKPRSEYEGMCVHMEIARRGPPMGWRARWKGQRVVGWVAYEKGWQPLLG